MSTLPGPRGPGPGAPQGNDSNRLMLTLAVSFGVIFLFQTFVEPPRPAPTAPAVVDAGPAAVPAPAATPVAPAGTVDPGAPPALAVDPEAPETFVRLAGQKLQLQISTRGGKVASAELLDFGQTVPKKGEPRVPVDLVSVKGEAGGTLRLSMEGVAPNASYRVVEESPTAVVMERNAGELKVVRRYAFDPASYGLKTSVEITNTGSTAKALEPMLELTGHVAVEEKSKGGFFSMGMPTDQTTFLCRHGDKLFREPAVTLKEPASMDGPVAWGGMDRQYFLAGYVARTGTVAHCNAVLDQGTARLDLKHSVTQLPPGQTLKLDGDVYFGPKQERFLAAVDPGLSDAIDFGWFGVLVRVLLAMLLWFYNNVVANYGVNILMLTLTVKLATLPLSQRQYVSMQRMKDIGPKVKELQEKFAHDKAMQGQKLMDLYKENNVNPAGGCLPMVIQMPVWIALYRTLFTSVELYQQPFVAGWIDDLTQKDPFYITPIVLGGVMLVQAWLTPQPQDNPQMKYMQYGMPAFFTFLMANLPAGLTVYMLFNAVLTILQQLYIKRRYEGSKPKAAGA